MLTEESKGRIRTLCNEIAKETSPERFAELLRQLNYVFDSEGLAAGDKRDGNKPSGK